MRFALDKYIERHQGAVIVTCPLCRVSAVKDYIQGMGDYHPVCYESPERIKLEAKIERARKKEAKRRPQVETLL